MNTRSVFSEELSKLLDKFSSATREYLMSFNNETLLARKIELLHISADQTQSLFPKAFDRISRQMIRIPVSIFDIFYYDIETVIQFDKNDQGYYIEPVTKALFSLDMVQPARKLINVIDEYKRKQEEEIERMKTEKFLRDVEQGDTEKAFGFIVNRSNNGALFNQLRTSDYHPVLITALRKCDEAAPLALLNVKGINPNVMDENQTSALAIAAERGFIRFVQVLLNLNNIQINMLHGQNKKGQTPLMLAAMNGQIEIMQELLNLTNPSFVFITDLEGKTVVDYAAKDPAIVSALIRMLSSHMETAIKENHDFKDFVKQYIKNFPNEDLYNFIEMARKGGYAYMRAFFALLTGKCTRLDEVVASVVRDHTSDDTMISLLISAMEEDNRLCTIANVVIIASAECTDAHKINRILKIPSICLLLHNAPLAIKSAVNSAVKECITIKYIETFLNHVRTGNCDLVALFIHTNNDLQDRKLLSTCRYINGFSPAHMAVNLNNIQLLEILHRAGFEMDAPVRKFTSVIIDNCRLTSREINGRLTPLMLAVKQGALACAEFLIETCHANLNVIDEYGATLLENAKQPGREILFKLISQRLENTKVNTNPEHEEEINYRQVMRK